MQSMIDEHTKDVDPCHVHVLKVNLDEGIAATRGEQWNEREGDTENNRS
jgi:hypothetical protein